jgi:hypothetical protein
VFKPQVKHAIAAAVEATLRATNDPELPNGNIRFTLLVDGAESWSWAIITDNARAPYRPEVKP